MQTYFKKAGFTLVEVIVSIAIFSLLLLAINALFVSLYRQQGTDMGMIERTRDAGRTVENLSREIREANRGQNGNFALATAGENLLVLYSDVDGDNLTEKISYALSGTDLTRTVVEPGTGSTYAGAGTTKVVCSNVRNGSTPIFTYYDKNYTGSGSPMTSPVNVLNVKLVGVYLKLNSTNGNSSYPFYIETKTEFRNLN